jgi:hypothetical protein
MYMYAPEATDAAANRKGISTGIKLADAKINAKIVEVKLEAVNAGIYP